MCDTFEGFFFLGAFGFESVCFCCHFLEKMRESERKWGEKKKERKKGSGGVVAETLWEWKGRESNTKFFIFNENDGILIFLVNVIVDFQVLFCAFASVVTVIDQWDFATLQ